MMDLARMLLAHGEQASAVELLQQAIANRHEDEDTLQEARAVFREIGMEAEGERIITRVCDSVVRLNNDGVRLAEDGRLEEASELFQRALRDLPANRTINMNTAKVLLLRMKRAGRDELQLRQVRECLERLQQLDPGAGAVQRLSALYREVAAAN
jgi:tetratricopeptide (TPR) repeat protein